jgi:pyruvate kinase
MRGYYRQTKIVATVGPATESSERLRQIIMGGVDVIWLNMAHGSGECPSSRTLSPIEQ